MVQRVLVFVLTLLILQTSDRSISQPDTIPISDGVLRRIHVPILMYHYVSPLPPDADVYRVDLTVEPDVFQTHIDYLLEEGYQTITLYQLHMALTQGEALPEKPIVLTFDDGHIDHYQYVFPMLKDTGLSGTYFVITDKPDSGDPLYMSWDQISKMAAAGMDMQAHTKSHPDLRERDRDFLIYEILGSMESLEAHTGNDVHMLAYPAGRYDDNTLQITRELGILRAVTTEIGAYHTTTNTLEVQRLRISGNMSRVGLHNMIQSSK